MNRIKDKYLVVGADFAGYPFSNPFEKTAGSFDWSI